jgi:hypothetical protein
MSTRHLASIFLLISVGLAGSASRSAEPPAPAPSQPGTQAPTPAPPGPDLQGPLPGARSPRNANYSINARLDPATRTITGSEVLTWRNIARAPAPQLRFHLYYNAWRNTDSTWMRERRLGRGTDQHERPEADWGWIDVTAIRLLGAGSAPPVDLTARARHIAPDDGNAQDRTVLEVPLDQPVEPGGTINVQVEWTARVPRTFSRTGAIGNFYFLAQWFPKIGVFEDAGWNCHQFHTATEFFADFGVYDVRLTAPRAWIVGATGRERERRDNPDGTTTHQYVEEDVHDFAWTASPDYLERTARFEHPGLPPVDMRLLLQPEHAAQAERHFAATRAALRYYGTWFGPYPYGHITVVDPAWQSGAGGMEYPTLFTAGTRWLAPAGVLSPEGVTIHEAGHEFWYGIVANNEFEDAWLDEGLNSFSEARVAAEAFLPTHPAQRYFGGFLPWVLRDISLARETDLNGFFGYREAARADVPATPTWRYWPGTASRITYDKTALCLNTLERHLGWPTLQKIMSTFFQRWAFRHPRPQDFFDVVFEVSGQDLTWFFDEVYRSSNVFDYGIQDLTTRPASGRGHYGEGAQRAFSNATDSQGLFDTTVAVRRYGEGVFPVDVIVTFENGETARERWDGRDRWTLFHYRTSSKAVSAQVDPDRVLLLDVNYTNNSWTLRPAGAEAARKWSLAWMIWLQDLLVTYGFFV